MANVELNRFKAEINLVEYASTQGYGIDRKESSRSSIVMRRGGDNDKIIISRDTDRHWIYFSVRSDTDNGSIIDFVIERKDLTLGQVRQELRPWVGEHPPKPDIAFAAERIKPTSSDRQKVLRDFSTMKAVQTSPYLASVRSTCKKLSLHAAMGTDFGCRGFGTSFVSSINRPKRRICSRM